jgi:predicted small secreted protein
MKKIKKSIAVFAALLLMSSSLNASIALAESCFE